MNFINTKMIIDVVATKKVRLTAVISGILLNRGLPNSRETSI